MAKVELKTRPHEGSVEDFLNAVADERKRADSFELLKLFEKVTGEKPKMWGPSIIGFGTCHLKYSSGREMDWPIAAFSPRKVNLTLYLEGFTRQAKLMSQLGKYNTGKSCLYFKKLADVDRSVLEEVIRGSVDHMRAGGTPDWS